MGSVSPDATAPSAALTLERYAEVLARLRHERDHPRTDVLSELGVSQADWSASSSAWVGAVDAELERDESALALRFAGAFSGERDRLRGAPPEGAIVARIEDSVPPAPVEPDLPLPPLPSSLAATRARSAPELAPVRVEPDPTRLDFPATAADVTTPTDRDPADETAIAMPALRDGPPLPFGTTPTPGLFDTPIPAREPSSGPRSDEETIIPDTVFIAGAVLPFMPSRAAGLTIEQYASLRAELSVAPADAPGIYARYGISPELRTAFNRDWESRFAREPPTKARYETTYAQYLAWLVTSRE